MKCMVSEARVGPSVLLRAGSWGLYSDFSTDTKLKELFQTSKVLEVQSFFWTILEHLQRLDGHEALLAESFI